MGRVFTISFLFDTPQLNYINSIRHITGLLFSFNVLILIQELVAYLKSDSGLVDSPVANLGSISRSMTVVKIRSKKKDKWRN